MDLTNHKDEFTETLLDLARENGELLAKLSPKGRRKFVRLAIKGARVAFALWLEGEDVHAYCLKGRDILGTGRTADTTAIAVKSRIDAIGIANDWGDGAPHLHEMPRGVM